MFSAPILVENQLVAHLDQTRAKGKRLPDATISHRDVCSFLCQWPARYELFTTAMRYRSFANYGPRVGWKDDPPVSVLIGPAGFLPDDVNRLISQSAEAFIPDLLSAITHASTRSSGIGLVILHSAAELLDRPELNFSGWSPNGITQRASELVKELRVKYDQQR
jgi:hypothetical protein